MYDAQSLCIVEMGVGGASQLVATPLTASQSNVENEDFGFFPDDQRHVDGDTKSPSCSPPFQSSRGCTHTHKITISANSMQAKTMSDHSTERQREFSLNICEKFQ